MLFNPIFEYETLRKLANEMYGGGYNGTAGADIFSASNIYTDDQNYIIGLPAPGVKSDDVDVNFSNGVLTIGVKRRIDGEKPDELKKIRGERTDFEFTRSFTLSNDVDVEKIDAQITNGLLMIRLPKKPESQPKKISVKVK